MLYLKDEEHGFQAHEVRSKAEEDATEKRWPNAQSLGDSLSLSQCLTVSGLVQPCVHVVIAADLPSPVRSKGKARAKEEEQRALEEGDGDPKL